MGIGYVGLPLAIVLAKSGYDVVGVDVKEEVVNGVNEGRPLFLEDDIKRMMEESGVRSKLRAQNSPCEADIFIISVPTPIDEKKRIADLSAVEAATRSIARHLRRGNLVVIESTVPPLTCRELVLPILEESGLKVGKDIFLAHCPERILPGDIFKEIVENDRVVGGIDPASSKLAADLYASFVKGKIVIADDITAEMTKLMENTYRDVNVALANEFAAVAEHLGIDVMMCIEIANMHPRVQILRPGIGTGGHCIPVDPWFIHQIDPANSRLIYTARTINEEVPGSICAKIRKAVKDVAVPRIVAVGVAYKPDTTDTRNSPSLRVIHELKEDGYEVEAYDPLIEGYNGKTMMQVAEGADCLVILVEHEKVKEMLESNWPSIARVMRNPRLMRFYPMPSKALRSA